MAFWILKTAWLMEIPKPYGGLHLTCLFLGLAVSVFAAYRLRSCNEKTNNVLLFSCGVFLVLTEVYKQFFYWYAEGTGQYRWGIFSFQLCSIPMYLLLILPFLKNGKWKQAMYDMLATYNLLGGFIAYLEPSGLLHEYVTITAHALIWHMMLVFIGLYLIFSGRACRNLKDFRNVFAFYGMLCLMAIGFNAAFWRLSEGQINMFFLGFHGPDVIVFDSVFARCGWLVSTAFFILSVTLGAFAVFYAGNRIQKKLHPLTPSAAGLHA